MYYLLIFKLHSLFLKISHTKLFPAGAYITVDGLLPKRSDEDEHEEHCSAAVSQNTITSADQLLCECLQSAAAHLLTPCPILNMNSSMDRVTKNLHKD